MGQAKPPAEPLSEHRAACELLRLGQSYDGSSESTMASFGDGEVSLPAPGHRPVPLGPVLRGTPRRFLEQFESNLLKDDLDWGVDSDSAAQVKPYCDPKLHSDKVYVNFCLS